MLYFYFLFIYIGTTIIYALALMISGFTILVGTYDLY